MNAYPTIPEESYLKEADGSLTGAPNAGREAAEEGVDGAAHTTARSELLGRDIGGVTVVGASLLIAHAVEPLFITVLEHIGVEGHF